MTELSITLFIIVVWLAKGHYDPSVPLLVLVFLIWVGRTLIRKDQNEIKQIEHFPKLAALLFAIKPNVMYVSAALQQGFLAFRALPAILIGISLNSKFQRFIIPFFTAFYLLVLYFSPSPHIDVFTSNTAAVDYLLKGLNPYSQAYSDIYAGEFDYRPGFLYWPGALYLQTLSKLLTGDIRAVLAIAWATAAYFLPHRRRMLWLTLPFAAFGVEQGWLDPILSFCAAASLWAIQTRRYSLLALMIAAAASIKQYGFLIGMFSVAYLWLQEKTVAFYRTQAFKTSVRAAILFIISLLPFLIWSSNDFIEMTLKGHAHALARPDSLNFTAFWIKTTGREFSSLAQLTFTLIGFALAGLHLYRRVDQGVKTIAEAWAIAFGFSILFGKFAFCNYHWLLISFWILSMGSQNQIAGDGKDRA